MGTQEGSRKEEGNLIKMKQQPQPLLQCAVLYCSHMQTRRLKQSHQDTQTQKWSFGGHTHFVANWTAALYVVFFFTQSVRNWKKKRAEGASFRT